MAQTAPLAELILSESGQGLGTIDWAGVPQPGGHLGYGGQTYVVLERRHRYQLCLGRYQLQRIQIYVKPLLSLEEVITVGDRILIGDPNCRYNARSELVRCAVNPTGPCQGCRHFQAC